jgi:hypothetical protein
VLKLILRTFYKRLSLVIIFNWPLRVHRTETVLYCTPHSAGANSISSEYSTWNLGRCQRSFWWISIYILHVSKFLRNWWQYACHRIHSVCSYHKNNSMIWVRERNIPTEQPPLVGEVISNLFGDRGCHVVSVTDPYCRILGFLYRSLYFSIK